MQHHNRVTGAGARRPRPKDREFLCEQDLRLTVHEGRPGLLLRVRLPSYRSLPLSCVERIELSLDGQPVESAGIRLILAGYSHRLSELPGLHKVFWWILDEADLFVPRDEPLEPGEHLVEGTMVTVEPYMTGGRFPMYYSSRRCLSVASDD